ncbi:hypothetical protein PRZ48_001117 [Zasmidium cellare]|uniref:Patatin-like phospholipase domain-containing protein n=1 Tax=Zasmidium cellare TaxID=395010 RepID=A0ABR0F0X4_ZASCE|nr:hypothetical protein PRZ48_001117 [Zasmidium cellare]
MSNLTRRGDGGKREQGEELWSRIAKVTLCSQYTNGSTKPVNAVGIANDVLGRAYNLKRTWSGQGKATADQEQELRNRMKDAKSYDEWRTAAERLDILLGKTNWKFVEESDDCDMVLLRRRLDNLKDAINQGDIEEMVHLIRTSLKRDLGGMCHVHLYQHCNVGTKHLIEEYTDVVKYTIEEICKYCESADLATVDRYLSMLRLARQSFGKSALMLSGGGTLGMCHIGVVKALLQENLLPKVVCGSSAGSIVGAVLCTQKGRAILDKLDELCNGDLSVFQHPNEMQGIAGMATNILKGEPAFDIANLCRVMRNLLGDMTFKEAYNMTGMILNIHVSTRDKHHLPRLLNYQTAPNVVIWSAVASSCALPLVFSPPGLQQKNPDTQLLEAVHGDHRWIDGSIEGDVPSQILERLFNINNFIASQVNPHVSRFLPQEGAAPSLLRKAMLITRSNSIFLLDGIMDRGYDAFPIKAAHAVLSQKYDGNVTILPDISWVNFTKILANPSHEFMGQATRVGERATWPKVSRIKISVDIELALDRGIKDIQAIQVGQQPNSVKSRRNVSSTRSERGLGVWRSRSSGPGGVGLTPIPRVQRGRANISAHRPVKSMVEPFTMPPLQSVAALQVPTEQIQSSSDETISGHSSPNTSYDDDDMDDDDSDDDETIRLAEEHERMRIFRSQPASPSISKKTFWGIDSAGHGTPPSPEGKRAWSSLHMSNVQDDFILERKKRRQEG